MRLVFIVATFAVATAGCQSQAELNEIAARQDHAQCASMGYERGTALYLQCRQLQLGNRALEQQRDAEQRRAMREVGAALMQTGKPPPTLTTNCSTFMGNTTCTTR